MQGILGQLPPGLAGWVAGDQVNQQKQAMKMQELQGILGMENMRMQQAQAAQLQPLQLQLLQAQVAKAARPENPFAKIDPSKYTPESVKKFAESGGTNFGLLDPLRKKDMTPAGEVVDLYNATPGQRFDVTTPHQAWQQNVQFPTTQQVERARLANEGQRIGIDRANLYFNTGMAPMGGGAPAAMPSVMGSPVQAPRMPQAGVVPPRGAPVQQQNFVPPNAQMGTPPGVALPPKAALEVEVDRRKKAGEMEAKRDFNMRGISEIIGEAEAILTGPNKPTNSFIGAGLDMAGRGVGFSMSGAKEADKLEAIGGALVARMPRMEGPQSDRDVAMYREMAGKVADRTIPIEGRLAALDAVKTLWAKYDKAGAPSQGGDIGAQIKALGVPYEPNVYDYRIVNGQVQRKKK